MNLPYQTACKYQCSIPSAIKSKPVLPNLMEADVTHFPNQQQNKDATARARSTKEIQVTLMFRRRQFSDFV